jgi:hypothetical protein
MLGNTVDRDGDIVARDVDPNNVGQDNGYGDLEKCSNYFKDEQNPIWFGRVQGLTPEN